MPSLVHRRSDCRLCESREVVPVFSLTPTPPANAFVPKEALGKKQQEFPLDLFFCRNCAHLQLLDAVDPELLFADYVYVSGTSPVFVEHFKRYAEWAGASFGLKPGELVVDIGSNDGTLLKAFKDRGMRVCGVDPAREIARRATEAGIPTVARFFTPDLAEELRHEQGPAALVAANNVFAHADDLDGIIDGVRELLAPEGVFTFEVSYLLDVYEKTLFDTIYHEHVSYHSVKPLRAFFLDNGMELIDATRVDSHGGSLRGVAKKASGSRPVRPSVAELVALEEAAGLDKEDTFRGFAKKIDAVKKDLTTILADLKRQGKRVAGFGAPAKATTLMYHFGLGTDAIEFIVDDSPLKQGLYSPGLHVPVLPSSAIAERKPDYLVILAWNFAAPIIAKNQAFRDAGGKFIVPLPKVEIL